MIKKITIIGSGNVATRLSIAFKNVNITIQQLYCRNKVNGKNLAKLLETKYVENISQIEKTDLIIICVNDDNIKNVVKKLPEFAMVHTSGSTSINVFQNKKKYGVLYPLQSLNKEHDINFQYIPICIEANSNELEKNLIMLSQKISNQIHILNSIKRKKIHLAAVIASNFSNYCYLVAENILNTENINPNILQPLIEYTAQKNAQKNPKLNQTGPARRNDKVTMQKHLDLLNNKNYKKIYKLLSQSIIEEYEK